MRGTEEPVPVRALALMMLTDWSLTTDMSFGKAHVATPDEAVLSWPSRSRPHLR